MLVGTYDPFYGHFEHVRYTGAVKLMADIILTTSSPRCLSTVIINSRKKSRETEIGKKALTSIHQQINKYRQRTDKETEKECLPCTVFTLPMDHLTHSS